MKVLDKCREHKNKYVFQTKNPKRMVELRDFFPVDSIFGTTIESNRDYDISKCPSVSKRVYYLKGMFENSFLSLEPILDFDLDNFVLYIKAANPDFVSIGADSKGHNLVEPDGIKIKQLIQELSKFTEVRLKKNLKRIIGGGLK